MIRRNPPVNAAVLLASCDTACPADLPATRVLVRHAPGWLRAVWRGPFAAIALPWGIYFRDEGALTGSPALGPVVIHELVHMEQWRRLGVVGFLVRYLTEYVRGRQNGLGHFDAYSAISLETEARRRAGI